MGVPVVGCSCPVCLSESVKNKRLRSSGLLEVDDKRLLIDCGPDFRQQALSHRIHQIDGCLITHLHHDHTASIDELRCYTMKEKHPLPCVLSKETADDLKRRFDYIFRGDEARLVSKVQLQELEEERGSLSLRGVPLSYMTFEQAGVKVTGFRMGHFAYLSDIKTYPETIFEDLAGVRVLVLSALRLTPSPLHFSVDEAVDFARKAGAKETYLTHISHDLDHEKTNAYLPQDIRMAYDGLLINF
ncbi:Beta-lactamase [Estrella lausannensis]|uniref:Beta-lactamase n=2 Tax=Estrella lausannensis TaxID=483423 RepID=A0A0H5DQG6_9BACT|nr:Beta-lactamase [Estrella lausannensis]